MTDLRGFKTLEELADALVPLLADRASSDGEPPWNDSEPSESDPWGSDQPEKDSRSQARSAPSRSNSGSRSSSRGGRQAPCTDYTDFPDSGSHFDRFEREWFFGEPDAPVCKGDHTSARLLGESQNGNQYEVWACPVGFGKNYKKKCNFWEYVS